MRYRVIFDLPGGDSCELAARDRAEASAMARRLNEPGEWWEIVDTLAGRVVDSAGRTLPC